MFHREILQNKTQFITISLPGTSAITILVMYAVGSRYEQADMQGASHFIEHLMFKGTQKRPRPIDISRALDSLGAEYNAFTGKDCTGYYVKASSEKLTDAAELLCDMLYNSLFAEEELEREKGVVIEEINMYKDNPSSMVEEYFEELVFPNHPLGRYIGGTEEVIRKMTRDAIITYRGCFYAPQNATVVIAGRLRAVDIARVKRLFAGAHLSTVFHRMRYKRASIPQTRPPLHRLIVKQKETDQAHLVLGFPALKLSDARHASLAVLNTVAGGSMSSRLFDVVREQKGLAYMIHSGVCPYQDVGTFTVQAGLNKTRVADAILAIKEELARLARDLMQKEELTRAKDYIIGKTILQMEESNFWASWYAKQAVLLGCFESPDERLKKIKKVAAEDVRALARRIFNFSALHAALIGPYKDKRQFVKLV